MRVAAIYDIHGNLPALEAVLQEIHHERVDHIVVVGDVLPGPMPRETLERLRDLDPPTHFIYGNGEVAVLQQMAGKEPSAVPQAYRPVTRWTAEQLHPEHQKWLSTWPKTLTLQIADLGSILFCHATPQNENDIFTRLTPDDRLLPLFEALQAAIVVCGHTHMQFDRSIGRSRVVNAGSVGMPFGEPVANWLLLGPDIQFRHTAYDLAHTAERIRSTNYPQAQHFAERYILNPPTETDARVIHPRRILRQPQIKKSALPASVKQKKARKIPSRPFSESSKGCPAVSIPANVSFRPKQTDAFSSTFAPAKVSVCAVEKSLFVLSRSPGRFPTL